MIKISDLSIGDMFNTKVGRYVKVSDTEVICVMSGIEKVGEIKTFTDMEVIPLYCMLKEWGELNDY